ncbi:hypothetical protein NDU88_000766 [Pleurodeles waltl]|uniref:Uncharacterized protein n=1 Tax=Pleurodeles waltl TaxID=8319 RepID=A0AAV7TI59_PLEWA|nr:hypothetical protein NDU88_000766 [Pleurodeles waltl]
MGPHVLGHRQQGGALFDLSVANDSTRGRAGQCVLARQPAVLRRAAVNTGTGMLGQCALQASRGTIRGIFIMGMVQPVGGPSSSPVVRLQATYKDSDPS